jgi:hypothetical protein
MLAGLLALEVTSLPLFISTRPEVLLTGRQGA